MANREIIQRLIVKEDNGLSGSLDQQVMNTAGLVAIAGKSQFVVNAANI